LKFLPLCGKELILKIPPAAAGRKLILEIPPDAAAEEALSPHLFQRRGSPKSLITNPIMSIYQKVGVRGYEVSEVFAAAPEADREVLCTYLDDVHGDKIEAVSNTFTIVMNRDITKSIEISSHMSVFLARKFPGRNVMLVNTYAGTALLQRTLAFGIAACGGKVPAEHGELLPHDYKKLVAQNGEASDAPKNLRILDCPSGLLDASRIDDELNLMGCADDESAIVILNSFEFSAWGFDRSRKAFAEGLVELQVRRALTMVIFSHEIRADVQVHTPAHGAIGVISAFAGSVWYLMRQTDRAKFNAHYRRIASLTNCGPRSRADDEVLQTTESY
jgi:hypothetical protein